MVHVVVFDGKMGVEVSLKLFGAKLTNTACLVFALLTKSTKLVVISTNHSILFMLDLINERFLVHLPIGFEQSINGIVDLVRNESLYLQRLYR
jgi:hypothetical protein